MRARHFRLGTDKLGTELLLLLSIHVLLLQAACVRDLPLLTNVVLRHLFAQSAFIRLNHFADVAQMELVEIALAFGRQCERFFASLRAASVDGQSADFSAFALDRYHDGRDYSVPSLASSAHIAGDHMDAVPAAFSHFFKTSDYLLHEETSVETSMLGVYKVHA